MRPRQEWKYRLHLREGYNRMGWTFEGIGGASDEVPGCELGRCDTAQRTRLHCLVSVPGVVQTFRVMLDPCLDEEWNEEPEISRLDLRVP